MDNNAILYLAAAIVVGLLSGVALSLVYKKALKSEREAVERSRKQVLEEARREAEALRKEASVAAKDLAYQAKSEAEREIRERNKELNQLDKRLRQKEEMIDKKTDQLERRDQELGKKEREYQNRDRALGDKEAKYAQIIRDQTLVLERLSGSTSEDARERFARTLLKAFRRNPLSPVATVAWLGLAALDLAQLRGAIAVRALRTSPQDVAA
jgi:ribonuclease Y